MSGVNSSFGVGMSSLADLWPPTVVLFLRLHGYSMQGVPLGSSLWTVASSTIRSDVSASLGLRLLWYRGTTN